MAMEPIKKLVIRHERMDDGYSEFTVGIDDSGSLVLEGVDAGEEVRRLFGDWDYEYWLTIPAEYRESVLLYLIKERFSSVHDMREWLKEKNIPCEFTSY